MDSFLEYDEAALAEVRAAKPWMADPRYFKTALISSAAAIKMLAHANSGVEKGLKAGSRPVEVMGLLLGRPSTGADKHVLIVTDAFPLPIEGAETRVLADDQEVLNYMISMMENLEKTRKERFMGWYHSHPFDVDVYSHCHLSGTDVSTQLQWQRSEDGFGSPWLGIVIDPLRSLAKNRPEFGAFRAFPPEFTSPQNMVPDGSIVLDDSRIERWGNAWSRYHSLDIQYFSSSLGAEVLKTVSENYLWKTALSTTPILDKEHRERFPEVCLSLYACVCVEKINDAYVLSSWPKNKIKSALDGNVGKIGKIRRQNHS